MNPGSSDESQAIAELVQGFENCTLPADAWTHRAHLTVALWYLIHHPQDEATRLIRHGIQRYNAAHGKGEGYHETVTLAWVQIISRFIIEHEGRPLADLVELLLDRCGEKTYLLRFYSRERILSDAARAAWVPPDVADFDAQRNELFEAP